MDISKLIYDETTRYIEQEISSLFDADKAQNLLNEFNNASELSGSDSVEDIIIFLQDNEELKALEKSISAFKFLRNLDKWSKKTIKSDLNTLDQILKHNSDNRFYSFLWLLETLILYKAFGSFDRDIAIFLNRVFNEFDFLVEQSGFIKDSGLFLIKEPGQWTSEIYVPVFENAIQKYPEKYVLREKLGQIYSWNGQFPQAYKVLKELEEMLGERIEGDFSDKDFDYLDYLKLYQDLGTISLQLDKKDLAMSYTTFVIDHVPENEKDIFVPSYLNRIYLHMGEDNISAIKTDYQDIVEWEGLFEFFSPNYDYVLNYIQEHKKELSK